MKLEEFQKRVLTDIAGFENEQGEPFVIMRDRTVRAIWMASSETDWEVIPLFGSFSMTSDDELSKFANAMLELAGPS